MRGPLLFFSLLLYIATALVLVGCGLLGLFARAGFAARVATWTSILLRPFLLSAAVLGIIGGALLNTYFLMFLPAVFLPFILCSARLRASPAVVLVIALAALLAFILAVYLLVYTD